MADSHGRHKEGEATPPVKRNKAPAVTDPALKDHIAALDARLTRMESDLAVIMALLHGRSHITPQYVAERLGLPPAQSRVAVALAEGSTARDIAQSTGRAESTIRHHFKQIYRKLNISSQTELVSLILLLPFTRQGRDHPDPGPGGSSRSDVGGKRQLRSHDS